LSGLNEEQFQHLLWDLDATLTKSTVLALGARASLLLPFAGLGLWPCCGRIIMASPEVHIFPNLEELSQHAASRFEKLSNQLAADGKIVTVALSGGSTPKRLYELLATPEFSNPMPWERIHFFQVDERCVPPDDAQSNYRMIRQALLEHAPIPNENFHRMEAERANLEDAARRYALEIASILAPAPGEWPRFDLILLGMGPDGHTASLFPGSRALGEHSAWVCPNYIEKFHAHRLTLTLPVINAATEVIFLVAGSDKTETLRRVLRPESEKEALPAQMVRPSRGCLAWFLDAAAARPMTTGSKTLDRGGIVRT
jgi:6-phosphogluconolactonase